MPKNFNIRQQYDGERKYCEDFNERKGCGQEIRIIKRDNGKFAAVDPIAIWAYTRDGKAVRVFVEHWMTCPEQTEYKMSQLHRMEQQDVDFQAQRDAKNEPGVTHPSPKSSFNNGGRTGANRQGAGGTWTRQSDTPF